jgi:hypothetical protein
MQIGDVVSITAGPFAGLRGLLKASGPRVLIAIEIRGRSLDVEMDLDWVSEEALARKPAIGIEEPALRSRGQGT